MIQGPLRYRRGVTAALGEMKPHLNFFLPWRKRRGQSDHLLKFAFSSGRDVATLEAARLGIGDDIDKELAFRECRRMLKDGFYAIGQFFWAHDPPDNPASAFCP